MGVGDSRELKIYQNEKVGALSIDLNKEFFFPGENLNGNIWIKLLQDLDVYGCELKLQMQEKWNIKQDKTEICESNFQLISNESVSLQNHLVQKGDSFILPKGEYNIPFNLKIMDFLLPSFEFAGNLHDSMNLRYVIYCCVLSQRGEKFCLSNLNYVMIRAPPKELNSCLTYTSCLNVRSWFFFQQGTFTLNVSYPMSNYKYGERIFLTCNLDNTRSKLKVLHVKTCLIQKIHFKNLSNTFTCYENELESKKIKVNCIPGTQLNFTTEIIVKNSKLNKNMYKFDLIPTWQMMKNSEEIFKFQPSISSSLITCEYFAKVSVHFDAVVTYSQRPRVFLPISLTHQVNEQLTNMNNDSNQLKYTDTIPVNSIYEDINATYPII
jgi:hypothetical protein